MSDVTGQVDDVRRKIALDLAPLTRELETAEQGAATPSRRNYWRSLGDLAKSAAFQQWAHDEFPQLGQEMARKDGPTRRRFLQLMGASIALAGLGAAGCRRPEAKILPYSKKPVDVVIGKGMYYASTFMLAGNPIGVLAETHTGRPTKIEGNPLHPNSRGGTDLFAQASLLELYDPDRSRLYRNGKENLSREQFAAYLEGIGKEAQASKGAGLAVLLRDTNSPTQEMILEHMSRTMPEAKVYHYEPLKSYGSMVQATYDLSKAKAILSLDADIFGLQDDGVRYRRQFMDGRRADDSAEMNRLYVVEPAMTATGAIADHRLQLKASDVGPFAAALLAALAGWNNRKLTGNAQKWIEALAEDLQSAGANAVVVAGDRHGPMLQQVAYQINKQLGAIGTSVTYFNADTHGQIADLAAAIQSGTVKTLVIAHGNPVYDAPADLKFSDLLKTIPTTLHLGLYEDETGGVSTAHAPATHYLESWGDARASDGTVSAIQPMIDPLFGGMTAIELLARISAFGKTDPYELVRMSFRQTIGTGILEERWAKFLQEGVYAGKSADAREPSFGKIAPYGNDQSTGIELCFSADPTVYDGRFANNAWLQECPDPVTKLVWDNAAILSPGTAKSLGVQTNDVIRIDVNGASLEAPVFVLPGTMDNSITLPLGYGRTRGGLICQGAGVNAYVLRTTETMGFAANAKVTKTGKAYPLATTQEHWAIDLDKHFENTADEQAKERALIREGTRGEFQKDPSFAQKMGEHAPIKLNIYTAPKLDGANQWAMIVDLNACVGCNACVVACQAENNVPVVGKNEVIRGREMQWLRLDRYFTGEKNDDVKVSLQPMMCQHCENAPCEPVCPVNATVHSPEGLNEMVYNRCIGTRYCSNNCPYKVRRFNYYDWNKGTIRQVTPETRDGRQEPDPLKSFGRPQVMQPPMQEMLKMAENPNVTVRMRGVMEKCTFCVQRIESAKIETRAKVGQGPANAVDANGQPTVRVPEGAVVSACAQACPTQAIVFGDKGDPNSAFGKRWSTATSPRSYQVLEHLNVRPRTHYLAKIRNTNPKLENA